MNRRSMTAMKRAFTKLAVASIGILLMSCTSKEPADASWKESRAQTESQLRALEQGVHVQSASVAKVERSVANTDRKFQDAVTELQKKIGTQVESLASLQQSQEEAEKR